MNNITVATNDEGKILVTINTYDLWDALSAEDKESILADAAAWAVVKDALDYELGKSYAAPNFNPSIFELRKLIVTDPGLLSDIVVSFIKQVVEEWAIAEEKRWKAKSAFWKLYRQIKDYDRYNHICERLKIDTPFGEDDDHMCISVDETRAKIMKRFGDLLDTTQEGSPGE